MRMREVVGVPYYPTPTRIPPQSVILDPYVYAINIGQTAKDNNDVNVYGILLEHILHVNLDVCTFINNSSFDNITKKVLLDYMNDYIVNLSQIGLNNEINLFSIQYMQISSRFALNNISKYTNINRPLFDSIYSGMRLMADNLTKPEDYVVSLTPVSNIVQLIQYRLDISNQDSDEIALFLLENLYLSAYNAVKSKRNDYYLQHCIFQLDILAFYSYKKNKIAFSNACLSRMALIGRNDNSLISDIDYRIKNLANNILLDPNVRGNREMAWIDVFERNLSYLHNRAYIVNINLDDYIVSFTPVLILYDNINLAPTIV